MARRNSTPNGNSIREQVESLTVKSYERKNREPKLVAHFEGLNVESAYELADALVAEFPGLALNTKAIEDAGDTRKGGNAMVVRLEMPEGTPRKERKSFTVWHSGKGQIAGFPQETVEKLTGYGAAIS